jgi:hypothetical protein
MKKLILCVAILLTPSMVDARIDHKKGYDPSIPVVVCKEKTKKSVRQIIREILSRRRVEKIQEELYDAPPLNLDMDNTVPVPMPYIDDLKNLA